MRKKLLSLALALVMCLGLTVPAMAAEVDNGTCVYELSNDPIGTVEVNAQYGPGDNDVETVTVYIVPDGTTVTSKTVPNGRMPYYAYDIQHNEWLNPDKFTNAGEPFVVTSLYCGDDIGPIFYCVWSENLDPEYYDEYTPQGLDYWEGVCVMAQSAATAAGFTAQGTTTPSTPTTPPDTPAAPSASFTDVAADAYYAAPVTWAVEKGITNGTGNNQFSPGQDCTNAQILTFLWRAYGEPEPSVGNPFTNSIPDAYTKAAIWAYEKGMVSGTVFDVDKPCTRAMAVTYMWQAAGTPMPFASADSFTDVSADASYAMAVAWALEKGVTTGTSATTFSPDGICNRGQIVTFLHRNLA